MPTVRRHLAWALALSLVLRVVAGVWVATMSAAYPTLYDGDDYRDLAASIASRQGFSISRVRWFEAPRPNEPTPEAFRPPLLPFLAGWLLGVKPDSFARLLAFQAVLATLLAGVVAFLLLDVAGPAAAWAGLILCTIHPLFLHYSTYFSTEILFSLCLACFLWFWRWESAWRWPAVGIAIAMATLTRATAVLLWPLSLVAIVRVARPGNRLRGGVLVSSAFLLAMSPWMIRNYVVFGEPRLTSWYGGYIFWLGNNRFNLQAYRASGDREFLKSQALAWEEGIRLARSMQAADYRHPRKQEAFWLQHAWEDIQSYGIKHWLRLLAGKAWHSWRPWPLRSAHTAMRFWIVAIAEFALFAFGTFGLLMLWKRRSAIVAPIALLLVAGTAAHSLTFAHLRHRVPFLDLSMIVGAAALAEPVWRAWQRRRAAALPEGPLDSGGLSGCAAAATRRSPPC